MNSPVAGYLRFRASSVANSNPTENLIPGSFPSRNLSNFSDLNGYAMRTIWVCHLRRDHGEHSSQTRPIQYYAAGDRS